MPGAYCRNRSLAGTGGPTINSPLNRAPIHSGLSSAHHIQRPVLADAPPPIDDDELPRRPRCDAIQICQFGVPIHKLGHGSPLSTVVFKTEVLIILAHGDQVDSGLDT
jgi:hypothetical protein